MYIMEHVLANSIGHYELHFLLRFAADENGLRTCHEAIELKRKELDERKLAQNQRCAQGLGAYTPEQWEHTKKESAAILEAFADFARWEEALKEDRRLWDLARAIWEAHGFKL